jgi:hypothetical protein
MKTVVEGIVSYGMSGYTRFHACCMGYAASMPVMRNGSGCAPMNERYVGMNVRAHNLYVPEGRSWLVGFLRGWRPGVAICEVGFTGSFLMMTVACDWLIGFSRGWRPGVATREVGFTDSSKSIRGMTIACDWIYTISARHTVLISFSPLWSRAQGWLLWTPQTPKTGDQCVISPCLYSGYSP